MAQDEVGHGTHVAGTVACLSNNGVGVAGMTWSCRLMPVKVLTRLVRISDGQVRGTGSTADIAAGIRWAVDNGARVLNLSLGGTTDTQVERDAIAYAIAQGAVVVAAMGNAFTTGNPTSFPAAYPGVIAVGAITSGNAQAWFSQTGPHIDVAAPGVGILSTLWDNGFGTMDGTSMASPHVAGLAALILSCNGNLSAAQVGDIIRQTARPLRVNPTDPVPNNTFGFGCIDAEAALNRACPRRTLPITSCPQSTIVACETVQIRCPPASLQLRCPSRVTICETTLVRCPRPTQALSCPSRVVLCQRPSQVVRCPTVVCEDPGRPPFDPDQGGPAEQPDQSGMAGDWSDDDPYGGNYGGGNEGGA
ncbi:MAG: S8 family serine peptidase [Luteitalea sp.]